jgi:transposase
MLVLNLNPLWRSLARYLPKGFPRFTTVQNRFYAWRDSGLWEQIVTVLVMAIREAEGKSAAPSVAIVDSQSVKTTEAGGPSGYEAGKEVKGRKRHMGVATLGWRAGPRCPYPHCCEKCG